MTASVMALGRVEAIPQTACGPVLACVDGSSFSAGVCDHAAWAAERLGVGVDVLHVLDQPAPGQHQSGTLGPGRIARPSDPVVEAAAARLADFGAATEDLFTGRGEFVELASEVSRRAEVVVVGRRGEGTGPRAGLGSKVSGIVARCSAPVLIASKIFLPIGRALIVHPEGPNTRYRSFLEQSPLLNSLQTRTCSVAGAPPSARLRAARDLLVAPAELFLGGSFDRGLLRIGMPVMLA